MIISQVIEMVDHNEYCFALWDETIITNYLYEESVEGIYEHGCFIYGYDSEKQVFYTEGYFDNEKWEHYEVPYEIFCKAILYCPEKGEVAFIGYKEVADYVWRPDYEKIKIELGAYIWNSLSEDKKNSLDLKAIYHFFAALRVGKQVHYPSIYCIYEHKILFWKRLVYLAEHEWNIEKQVVESSKELMKEYRKVMLLGLAYNKDLEASLFEQMRSKAKQAIEKEKRLLNCIHSIVF